MRRNYLTIKKQNIKEIFVKDLRRFTKRSFNLTVVENELKAIYGFKSIGKVAEKPVKIYDINGKLFLLNNNGSLYRYDFDTQNSTKVSENVSTSATLLEVIKGGENKILIIDESGTHFEGEAELLNIPFGQYATVYDGRIITANGKTVHFCNAFDFSKFSHSDLNGTISVENDCGDIVGLSVLNGVLYVFCESAVFSLTTDEQVFFQFKKEPVSVNNIIKDSVCALCEKIVFFQNDGLYTFDGNTVLSANSYLSDDGVEIVGKAIAYRNVYVAPVCVSASTPYIYIYDGCNGKETIVNKNTILLSSGRYLISTTLEVSKILEKDHDIVYCFWESKPFDMDVSYQKTLLEISLYVSEKATATLDGEFGRKTLWLQKGYNVLPINLNSVAFGLTISSDNKHFYLNNLKLKYTVTGE